MKTTVIIPVSEESRLIKSIEFYTSAFMWPYLNLVAQKDLADNGITWTSNVKGEDDTYLIFHLDFNNNLDNYEATKTYIKEVDYPGIDKPVNLPA
jgi:hypothetical protein